MLTEKGMTLRTTDMSVTDLRALASDFAKSGYFADAREAVQAVVKIQAGLELGLPPVYAMTKIYIVKGRVTVSAELMGALVKRSGRYDYAVKTLTDTECVLIFTDNGTEVYTSKFTMDDAKKADLVKADSGWTKWPRAMLMSKALSQGARIVCPHVIAGTYTPEDFGVPATEQGEVIESTARVVETKTPVAVDKPEPAKSEDPTVAKSEEIPWEAAAVEAAGQGVPVTASGPDVFLTARSILFRDIRKNRPALRTDKNVEDWLTGPCSIAKGQIDRDPAAVRKQVWAANEWPETMRG